MSKHKKPINWAQVSDDKDKLLKAGYQVIEKSPWHWHVRKKGNWVLMNVWPTVHKYMQQGASGSNHYKDVVISVNAIFTQVEGTKKDTQQKASQEVEGMREGGLEAIKNKYNL